MKYEYHEIANIFPMMSTEERLELKSGIETDGYEESHAVWLYQGKILDGRNRYEICNELGIDMPFKEYVGKDPVGFVVQENIHRRQLDASQKAAVGVEIKRMWQKYNTQGNRKDLTGGTSSTSSGKNRDIAGKATGVSGRYIDMAEKVAEENPEMFEQVKAGNVNVKQAYKDVQKKIKKARVEKESNGQMTDTKRFEALDWTLPVYNMWSYPDRDKRFGQQHFGNIPPQVVANLLYLYTNEGDLVLDPFVGGGMTIDVCKYFDRDCEGFDLVPTRDDIKQHDISTGLPEISKNAKLIFLDPPYWKQAKKKYSNEDTDLSNMSLEDFYEKIESLFIECKKMSGSEKRYLALIIGMTKDNGIWVDHAFDIANIAAKYFNFVNRVIVPYSTQVHGGAFVAKAQKNKDLLYLFRDLLVYEF